MSAKENDNAAVGLDMVAGVIVFAVLIVWSAAWYGLTLSVLWAWFIAPFFNVDQVGVAQAYGLILVLRMMLAESPKMGKSEKFSSRLVKHFILTPFVAGLYMVIGWVLATCL